MKKALLCGLLFLINSVSADVTTPHQCMAPPSQKCFTVIVAQKFNWNDAEKYCEMNLPNGRLASVHNAFAGSIISGWLPFLSTNPWIGAFQIGSLPYQWTDGTSLDYTNWTPGEPTGPCGQICYTLETNAGTTCQQGKWRTADCMNITAQFICEYGNITNTPTTPSPPTIAQRSCNSENGKCFSLVIGALEWTDADQFCRSQMPNSDIAALASINSQGDANIIATFLQYPTLSSNVWIGASAFGNEPFHWSDGSSFSFTNWAPGQPNAKEGCVQVCLKTDTTCVKGQWTVVPCRIAQSFVCEIIPPTDCLDWHIQRPDLPSGIYTLSPPRINPFQAYCDMETEGGGWTVFQRRLDGSVEFYNRTWNEFKNGFGNGLANTFWLGLDRIHALSTKDASVTLRIEFAENRCTSGPGPCSSYPCDDLAPKDGSWYGEWPGFQVENEENWYRLHVEPINAGNLMSITWDSLAWYNGYTFDTFDHHETYHHDTKCSYTDCGQSGGWWYGGGDCADVNLNEKYDWGPGQTGFSYFIGNKNFPNKAGIIVPVTSALKLRRTG